MTTDISVSELTIEALRACRAWHIAESKSIGTFDARMELCQYSEWITQKALAAIDGEPQAGEYEGVPHLHVFPSVELSRCSEENAKALVKEVLDLEAAGL